MLTLPISIIRQHDSAVYVGMVVVACTVEPVEWSPELQKMAEQQLQNTLSLGDRVKLIDYAKKNPGVGTIRITEIFRCGRMQVHAIFKAKESIITNFKTNAPALRKRSCSTKTSTMLYTSGIVWPESDLYWCQSLCYSQKLYC